MLLHVQPVNVATGVSSVAGPLWPGLITSRTVYLERLYDQVGLPVGRYPRRGEIEFVVSF